MQMQMQMQMQGETENQKGVLTLSDGFRCISEDARPQEAGRAGKKPTGGHRKRELAKWTQIEVTHNTTTESIAEGDLERFKKRKWKTRKKRPNLLVCVVLVSPGGKWDQIS
jgi:hypothetical protein